MTLSSISLSSVAEFITLGLVLVFWAECRPEWPLSDWPPCVRDDGGVGWAG